MKFDFLGLKTLTVLARAVRAAAPRAASTLDLATLPLDDAKTYEMLGRGDTIGRVPAGRPGMRDVLRKLQARPLRGHHRPGRALPARARWTTSRATSPCKHGEEAARLSASRARGDPEGDLRHHRLPGAGDADRPGAVRLQLGGADLLRRAMGKKIKAEMEAQRKQLHRRRRRARRRRRRRPTQIFDLVDKFAGYGFNKCHAAAYALVAYQTA